jgi:glycosyltransferase involved in cell wall biosynthesis
MANDSLITLAFSTVGSRLAPLQVLIERLKDLDVKIIVVVQLWQISHQQQLGHSDNIQYIWSDTVGLSRSRNIAIEAASSDYLWLLDDDVDIVPGELLDLLDLIGDMSPQYDVFRVRVGCSENHNSLYKSYSKDQKISKLSLLKMNSIELIVRRDFVLANDLKFNPNIGLGTDYPGSEEIHFLLDLYEVGGRIKLVHKPYVYHSCLEGGRRKNESDAIMEIRGATASRLGVLGFPLVVYWGIRYLVKERRNSVVKALLKGYFRGYKSYR